MVSVTEGFLFASGDFTNSDPELQLCELNTRVSLGRLWFSFLDFPAYKFEVFIYVKRMSGSFIYRNVCVSFELYLDVIQKHAIIILKKISFFLDTCLYF